VGVGVDVGGGIERGAIAELRRGRESWLLATSTKLDPSTHVAAKTRVTTKANCRRLNLSNRSMVRFIINIAVLSVNKTP
jgi:uncharacterized protein Smg (DUF494 family)